MNTIFDHEILEKYNTPAPRYTSYPTALSFKEEMNNAKYVSAIEHIKQSEGQRSLSLYIHIPFCHSLCYYCGCNKVVTRHAHKAEQYIDYLVKEINARSKLFDGYEVSQIHFGGGTPSFLTAEQLNQIISKIKSSFKCSNDLDLSIEIDPRRIELSYASQLSQLGFKRLSIGVQDVNGAVQKMINRVQNTDFIARFVESARFHQFESVNLDLIYGLPGQDEQGFTKTLETVIEIDPDRISLFSYAHLPSQFAAQRKIKDEWLPTSSAKLALFELAVNKLTSAGYVFIGMDHFAKPDDELCIAMNEGNLHRNFQGYTTKEFPALLGLGVSSISSIHDVYVQNPKELKDYYKKIDHSESLIAKGVHLSEDDIITRDVIQTLMCNFYLDKSKIEEKHNIIFDQYYMSALISLNDFIKDDLVEITLDHIKILDKGRLVIRHICKSFDAYSNHEAHRNRYSKVI